MLWGWEAQSPPGIMGSYSFFHPNPGTACFSLGSPRSRWQDWTKFADLWGKCLGRMKRTGAGAGRERLHISIISEQGKDWTGRASDCSVVLRVSTGFRASPQANGEG